MTLTLLLTGALSTYGQVTSLKWMLGEWVMQTDTGTTLEKWWMENDSTLSGHATNSVGGKVVFEEELQIISRNGSITYLAKLPGKTAHFTLTSSENEMAKFADMMNDFPQIIAYSRSGNKMEVVLTGLKNGEFMRSVLHFSKK